MSSNSHVRWLMLVASLVALWCAPCAAQTVSAASYCPAECRFKPARAQKYQTGFSKGLQKADELFASSGIEKSPQKLQKKLDRVLDRLHDNLIDVLTSDSSDGRRCRVQGVADGFLSRIVQLLGQCILDGAQWGQFASTLYCQLSLDLGGLGAADGAFIRAPVGLCGNLFESTCDGVYAYIATEGQQAMSSTVARFVSERGVSLSPYPGCAHYSAGDFAVVFAASMQADCAYSAP